MEGVTMKRWFAMTLAASLLVWIAPVLPADRSVHGLRQVATPSPVAILDRLQEVSGITAAAHRLYGSIETTSADGVLAISVWVIEFASGEDAERAAPNLQDALTAEIAAPPALSGNRAAKVSRDDAVIVAVAVYTTGDDALEVADAIAEQVHATVPGSDAPSYSPDGASTGGIWDRFPVTGDPVLHGLTPTADAAPLDHPAATPAA
jgi:hypothetical protein